MSCEGCTCDEETPESICVEKDGKCQCDPCRCDKGEETTEGGW